MKTITTNPPNSILLVMDPTDPHIPESMRGRAIAETPSAVAVGTLCAADGPTTVSLGECPIPELDGELAFDGVLETPSGMIGVFSAHDEQLLGLRIGRERARVRIWTNDPTEPDRIHVVASPADGPPRGP